MQPMSAAPPGNGQPPQRSSGRRTLLIVTGILVATVIGVVVLVRLWWLFDLAAIAFMVIAWRKPAWAEFVSDSPIFLWLPWWLRHTPLRFASAAAAVMIPVALLFGAIGHGALHPVESRPAEAQVAPTTAPSLTPVPTPAPSPTPAPTAAAGVAQAIPAAPPTAVPTPTPVPSAPTPIPAKPAITPEQLAYIAQVLPVVQRLQASLQDATKLLGEVSSDHSVILDPAWQSQLAADASLWMTTYAQEQSRKAPPGLEAINAKWIEGLGYLNQSGVAVKQAIADVNSGNAADAITQVGRALSEGQKSLADAQAITVLLKDFPATH